MDSNGYLSNIYKIIIRQIFKMKYFLTSKLRNAIIYLGLAVMVKTDVNCLRNMSPLKLSSG